jgi:hypothetical protein
MAGEVVVVEDTVVVTGGEATAPASDGSGGAEGVVNVVLL